MSTGASTLLERVPVVRTLAVCTREARRNARTELMWQIGIAFLSVFVVMIVVLFSKPPGEFLAQLYPVISRGELMVYAAALCGATLYALRHSMKPMIPDVVASKVTSVGTLTVIAGTFMGLSMLSYVVRRMGDLHHIPLNDGLLFAASITLLLLSVVLAYVVFALKHSLDSGFSIASREQDADFSQVWQSDGRA